MELFILGSGSFKPARHPQAVRNPTGLAVRLKKDLIFFDLGFGNVWQLARCGLRTQSATDVFLTHRHPDHSGDLAALLFHLRYDSPPQSGRLRLWGPKGTIAFVKRLRRTFLPWLEPQHYRLEVRELRDGKTARGSGWRVDCLHAPHPTPALSYRLSAAGKSLVISGDSGPNPPFARFAAGCDTLLLEAGLESNAKAPVHLNAQQAVDLACSIAPRQTIFYHLTEASAKELRALLKSHRGLRGRVAADLMRVRIG